jgi:formate dehydrogenase major subunit
MAEAHPVGFQWVMEAKARGATIIHVDPRFTRTSAMADLHVPLRPGTDIAFLGGIVNHILQNERYFHDYVVNYTNAPVIVSKDFRDTEDLDGLFSGWDAEKGAYDGTSWQYEGAQVNASAGDIEMRAEEQGASSKGDIGQGQAMESHTGGGPGEKTDPTMQDPRCVLQILKRHFSRYTPEMVERVCGIPPELLTRVAETLCDNSGRERTGAFCYAVGWTQHTKGAQYIRTAAIIQLLLGNIGRPGGGIMALRGHASIQGSTDIPTLYDLLPGYIPMPKAKLDTDWDRFVTNNRARWGLWTEFPKYMVSLMRAWYGEAARADNGWAYDFLPRLTGDHSHMTTTADMADGAVKGYFVMGENPVVGSMHGALHRKAMRKLEWLVVRDFAPTETAEFWKNAPEIDRGEVRTEDIPTEVFFFPAATHTEKDGTFTNTQRLLQWHHKAVEPPGDCRSDLHFVYHLGRALKDRYAGSTEERDRGIQALTWFYPTSGPNEDPDAESVLAEINGYTLADRKPIGSYLDLKDDGSTAAGCWIYTGCITEEGNLTQRRKPGHEQTWVAPEWGWAWPSNRRILYSRASADPDGKPWSERKKYVWWDEEKGEWTGEDNPDFLPKTRPDYRPPDDAEGLDTIGGTHPFIRQVDGLGWLYAPAGMHDGPMPTHYEPQESPIENPLYGQQCNPARMEWRRKDNPYHRPHDDPRFPYVITTYRVTEHHTAGGMSRWLSWLAELQPELFCEVSPALAAERGLQNGGWATVTTARAEIECRVLVTERMQPHRLGKRTVHTIGLPYHWGRTGLVTGDAVNELIAFVGDPNVSIQESKALTGMIQAGRRSRERRAATGPPLGGPAPEADGRDRPEVARGRESGEHGMVAEESQRGEQA